MYLSTLTNQPPMDPYSMVSRDKDSMQEHWEWDEKREVSKMINNQQHTIRTTFSQF